MEKFDEVVLSIMQGDVLEILDAFMDEKTPVFIVKKDCEFTLQQYEAYQEFCDLLEDRVIGSCGVIGVDAKDFYKVCCDNQECSPVVSTFSTILLISTEFELFDDVMRDQEKRRYMFKIWRDWGNALAHSMGRK